MLYLVQRYLSVAFVRTSSPVKAARLGVEYMNSCGEFSDDLIHVFPCKLPLNGAACPDENKETVYEEKLTIKGVRFVHIKEPYCVG